MYRSIAFFVVLGFHWIAYGQEAVDENIRKRVELLASGFDISVAGEKIHCGKLLPEFYQKRLFNPAWDTEMRTSLIDVLGQAEEEGLSPEDYHFNILLSLSRVKKALSQEEKAEFDLLLTDAYLLYASHFLNGKVNPETVDSEWKAIRREGNAREFLENAMVSSDIGKSLEDLKPDHIGYAGLKEALHKYRTVSKNGGWPTIPQGETLKKGMVDNHRVPLLIERLLASQHLMRIPDDKYTYTETIEESVKKYQQAHGLEVDGNLGKQTLASLNTSVDELINQVRINMERIRWISQDLGEHYIIVNIADFRMEVYKNNLMTFDQKVIVGKPFRKTPVFSSKMTYMVLNPYWTVPPTILFNDILPELKKNSAYLATKNIRLFIGQGSNSREVDPTTVDWSALSRNNFPYTLRQDPGAMNALGAVKFMFPNKYNVYIHDTPSKELFNRADRAFSSGCIRLNKPMDFVEYLIKDDPKWDMDRVKKALEAGKEQTITLGKPLNVHILYLTAWSQQGTIHFRKDLYSRDEAVLNALEQSAPSI